MDCFPIKGVIWYQGEANVGRSEQYEDLFPALITDWRRQWRSDFPFILYNWLIYGIQGNTAGFRMGGFA